MDQKKKKVRRNRVKYKIRKRVIGTSSRPRLTVFRSLRQIYAQIIDDSQGKTLVSSSSFEKDIREKVVGKNKTEISFEIGIKLGQKAEQRGIKDVVFDRNGYAYHGRVKSLADGARQSGLNF